MGGAGSGWGYGWKTRPTVEQVKRLDVRWLHRQGCLVGSPVTITWSRNGELTDRMTLIGGHDQVVLVSRVRVARGNWDDIWSVIPLAWTACHYGGTRPWFCCPRCLTRVAFLVLGGRVFLCRHCYRLPYASQQETVEDRHYRKIRKLRDRVGASHNLTEWVDLFDKPKGMHWATYERLCAQERVMQQVISRDLSLFFQKLMPGLPW